MRLVFLVQELQEFWYSSLINSVLLYYDALRPARLFIAACLDLLLDGTNPRDFVLHFLLRPGLPNYGSGSVVESRSRAEERNQRRKNYVQSFFFFIIFFFLFFGSNSIQFNRS